MSTTLWFIFYDSVNGRTTLTQNLDHCEDLNPAVIFHAASPEIARARLAGFMSGFNLALAVDGLGETAKARAA